MNVNTEYWDRGIGKVEWITGVRRHVLDCHEVRDMCAQLDIALPFPTLLDVGCGTGRCSQLVTGSYLGVDIMPSAIEYCRQRKIHARLIDGPESLTDINDDGFDWILGWSLFSHIGREEQRAYLMQFARIAPNLLIDILPGDAGRSAARWGSDEATFRQDLTDAGYLIYPKSPYLMDKVGWAKHQYFRGTRR